MFFFSKVKGNSYNKSMFDFKHVTALILNMFGFFRVFFFFICTYSTILYKYPAWLILHFRQLQTAPPCVWKWPSHDLGWTISIGGGGNKILPIQWGNCLTFTMFYVFRFTIALYKCKQIYMKNNVNLMPIKMVTMAQSPRVTCVQGVNTELCSNFFW